MLPQTLCNTSFNWTFCSDCPTSTPRNNTNQYSPNNYYYSYNYNHFYNHNYRLSFSNVLVQNFQLWWKPKKSSLEPDPLAAAAKFQSKQDSINESNHK